MDYFWDCLVNTYDTFEKTPKLCSGKVKIDFYTLKQWGKFNLHTQQHKILQLWNGCCKKTTIFSQFSNSKTS